MYTEICSVWLIHYTGNYNLLYKYLSMFYKTYMKFIEIHTAMHFYHSFCASQNKKDSLFSANCFYLHNKIQYWPNTETQIKFQHMDYNSSMNLSMWGRFITVTLTKFFLSASPVQVDPDFPLGVIFYTWICFVVQAI
jgi:hypothetical protein